MSDTFPAAAVGVTLKVAVSAVPEVEPPLVLTTVVVVGVRDAAVHLVNRFPTLIEPRPVARSYPAPDTNATVSPLSTTGHVIPPFGVTKLRGSEHRNTPKSAAA